MIAGFNSPIYDLSRTADVPCDGCSACCRGAVPIRPELGDSLSSYRTESAIDPRSGLAVTFAKARCERRMPLPRGGGLLDLRTTAGYVPGLRLPGVLSGNASSLALHGRPWSAATSAANAASV